MASASYSIMPGRSCRITFSTCQLVGQTCVQVMRSQCQGDIVAKAGRTCAKDLPHINKRALVLVQRRACKTVCPLAGWGIEGVNRKKQPQEKLTSTCAADAILFANRMTSSSAGLFTCTDTQPVS